VLSELLAWPWLSFGWLQLALSLGWYRAADAGEALTWGFIAGERQDWAIPIVLTDRAPRWYRVFAWGGYARGRLSPGFVSFRTYSAATDSWLVGHECRHLTHLSVFGAFMPIVYALAHRIIEADADHYGDRMAGRVRDTRRACL
jgi:hypothetical protein